jgi:hypothetical protein
MARRKKEATKGKEESNLTTQLDGLDEERSSLGKTACLLEDKVELVVLRVRKKRKGRMSNRDNTSGEQGARQQLDLKDPAMFLPCERTKE